MLSATVTTVRINVYFADRPVFYRATLTDSGQLAAFLCGPHEMTTDGKYSVRVAVGVMRAIASLRSGAAACRSNAEHFL